MENKPMETKLYVGNLAYSTTEAEIHRLFTKAGRVTSVDLIKDQDSGKSKGFAFVTMGTPAEAQTAIGMLHASSLAGRELTVNLTRKRESQVGFQSRFSAFGLANQGQPAQTRNLGLARSGYQSRYSAFGDRNNNPTRPRRRGGSQRH
jgi:RNA recognition motif-containing protein